MNYHSGFPRLDRDNYPTPSWVSEIILPYIDHLKMVWEPACGEGKMVAVLARGGRWVIDTDISKGQDFLEQDGLPLLSVKGIITNSPYRRGIAQQFVEHALDLMKPVNGTVAMLLPHGWDMAQERAHLFEGCPDWRQKIAIRKRIRWFEGSKGNPRGHHAWFLWDCRRLGALPTTYWPATSDEVAA